MLLPYVVLLRLKSLISPVGYELQDSDSPFFQWLINWIDSPLQQSLFSILLVFIQAIAINRLVIRNSISTEQTLIPGLIYVLFASMIPDFLVLTPALVSASFILVAISNLFQIYGKKAAKSNTFNVGLLTSIASLIYYPSILFLIIGVIGFSMLRSISLKGILQILIGAMVPYYLLYVYYFYNDNTSVFHSFSDGKFIWINGFHSLFTPPYYAVGVLAGLAIISIFQYNTFIKAKSIQSQEKIELLYLYLIVFFITILIINGGITSYLIFLLVPISIFFTLWLLKIKNHIVVEFIHFGLLILLISLHFIIK